MTRGALTRRADCPDEAVWFGVAGGIADPERERDLLHHAADCDYCAALLKRAIADFSDDEPEAGAAPAEPPKKVVEMRPRAASWRPWAIAAAVALAAAGGWALGRPAYLDHEARALVAESERDARPTPFRIAGAPYARNTVLRGAGASEPRLEEARELAAEAGDEELALRIQVESGRAGEREIAALRRLRDARETPALDNLLGIAYASQGGSDASMKAAAEFDRALSLDSKFAPALFNKALALNRADNRNGACAAVSALLAIEKDEGWRAEAAAACPH
jgi:hypothetical protein